ncbi:MAG TPA: T9SS type A sorting domain-containing protein [Ignavibacteria bacterium]
MKLINFLVIKITIILFLLSILNPCYAQIWTRQKTGLYCDYGVYSLASQGNYIFAGTANAGIYRSSNNGANWFILNNGIGQVLGYTFFVSGSDLFCGAGEGLYYSSDFGQSWQQRGITGWVYSIIQAGPNLVIIKDLTYLYYSTNNGLNWINIPGWTGQISHTFYWSGSMLFIGTLAYGIYASSDYGMTWFPRNNGYPNYNVNSFSFFNGALYVGGSSVFRSFDWGSNWSQCNSGFETNPTPYIHSFALNNGYLFAGTDIRSVYRTSSGSSWAPARTGIEICGINALLSYNGKLFAGANWAKYGIFASTNNGDTWFKSGLNTFSVKSIIKKDSILFIGTDSSGMYSSTDGGDYWFPANIDMNNSYILSLIKHGSCIFAGTVDSGIYKSTNNGQNWSQVNSGLGNLNIKSFFSKDSTTLYTGTNSGIYKTSNTGQNWIYLGLINIPINTITYPNNFIVVGTNNGIQVSTNNGTNWISGILTGININSIYIFSNKLFAGSNNGVYISTDNGFIWNQCGLNGYSIKSFSQFADTLVASTSGGVFATSNNGLNWINLGPSQETNPVLVYNGYIYAGGINSVWKRIASTVTEISPISSNISEKFSLSQNYPNPFNPVTKIKFDIPSEGKSQKAKVKLVIYDILGKQITTLVNEQLQPGTYEVTFDGSNLPSGVYFYKLSAGDFTETKKMLMLK